MLFRGVGNTLDTNQEIWMRVTNESTYRAWNPRHNGVKRRSEGTSTGFFGALNLLGPRSITQVIGDSRSGLPTAVWPRAVPCCALHRCAHVARVTPRVSGFTPCAWQSRRDKYWSDQYTMVQLRYEFFVETSTGSYDSGAHALARARITRWRE